MYVALGRLLLIAHIHLAESGAIPDVAVRMEAESSNSHVLGTEMRSQSQEYPM